MADGTQEPPVDEYPGLFVTFEGCEGSGKTTQVELLSNYLLSRGRDAVITREPGGTEVGEKIRQILLDPGNSELTNLTEALLFAADRAQKVQEIIRPALMKGWTVVADRFVDSSLAYQGVGRGLGLEAVKNLNEWATGALEPGLTIFLDMPAASALARLTDRLPDRIEKEPPEFHENVRQAYLMLARVYSHRFVVLDGSASPQSIHARVIQHVEQKLSRSRQE